MRNSSRSADTQELYSKSAYKSYVNNEASICVCAKCVRRFMSTPKQETKKIREVKKESQNDVEKKNQNNKKC